MAVHATLSDFKISSALTTHEPQSLAFLSELSKSEEIFPHSRGSRAGIALRKKNMYMAKTNVKRVTQL